MKIKRILAGIIAVSMIFSLCACGKSETKENETTEKSSENEPTSAEAVDLSGKKLEVKFHYTREDKNYDGWNLWSWAAGADGGSYEFEPDGDSVVTSVEFNPGVTEVGFIVRLNEWEAKDIEADRFVDVSSVLYGTVDVYVTSGCEEFKVEYGDDCMKGTGIASAVMNDDFQSVNVTFTEDYNDDMKVTFWDGDNEINVTSIEKNEADAKKVTYVFDEKVDEYGAYKVKTADGLSFDIDTPDVYSTEAFENEFSYDGDDLGATWTADSTEFKVWAPTADSVCVNLYKSGSADENDLIETIAMEKGDKGVWTLTVNGDKNGVYYTYSVEKNGASVEACDPYAKAVGVNGDRAMVIDMAATNPEGWDKDSNPNSNLSATESSIYELHIRDLSADASSGITNTGKFLGLTEKGTVNSFGQSTGLDHILDLGVTHVQLTPVYDYATVDESKLDTPQYNWGYDPKNYNVPEGSYSTDPFNGDVRVKEFKTMVKTLHDNNLSVVMDVVYNHTYNTEFCFNKIVDGYFYRGSNGSGCGNDVASERAMVRKYIVDSVVYWAKEYHIDGFRFDLVGLIDVETIQEIRAALDEIDPSIILYGEGWKMSTSPTKNGTVLATQENINEIEGFGMFNDVIRDNIKGSVFNSTEKGYVNGDTSKAFVIAQNLRGNVSWNNVPGQLINYASCHDNMTLWDEINSSNGDDSEESKIAQNLLSAAIVYTAQGVPFILAGEEMLRSKVNEDGTFNENSYNAPDSVNSIKWDDLNDENHKTVYEYYKGLIAFRKAHKTFTMSEPVSKLYTDLVDSADGVIAFQITPCEADDAKGYVTIYNGTLEDVTIDLPEGEWTILVQGDKAGNESLGTASGSITVTKTSCTILELR